MMIVIQEFPSVAALKGWLHNKRFACKDQRSFTCWLQDYLNGRELTARGRSYRLEECIELIAGK